MGIDLSLKLEADEKDKDEEGSKHSSGQIEEEEDDGSVRGDEDEQMVKEDEDSCLGSRTREEENEREEVPTYVLYVYIRFVCKYVNIYGWRSALAATDPDGKCERREY